MSLDFPLSGHIVLAPTICNPLGEDCSLVRYLCSLGAKLSTELSDIGAASFLIDQIGATRLAELGLTRERLEREHPELIHIAVTCFGSYGPRAHWQGGELIASAMGGALRLTGRPEGVPVKEAYDACTFHAKMVAGAGAMVAHYVREKRRIENSDNKPLGQLVDISIQQVALSRNVNGVLVWQFEKRKIGRVGGSLNYGQATVQCIWALKDGWCFHSLMTGRFGAPANQGLSDWMDEVMGVENNPLHGVDWLAYNRSTLSEDIRQIWQTAIAVFFNTRTRYEIRTEGLKRKINACVLSEPQEVLDDPHLEARGFWARDENDIKTPSRFVSITHSPPEQSNFEAKLSVLTEEKPRTISKPRGPLHGVKVLDFSWALVGSFTTKVLGDLGAEIIKVETKNRPCLSRMDVQVGVSSKDSLDDKPWFSHMNTSKRSLTLNMKSEHAKTVLDPLIQWADLVIENFSPGTMAKLGLDYESLRRKNSNIIMVSGSVFGQTGPMAKNWGVDGTGAALSGRTVMTGYPEEDPVIPGAVPYGDVIVPYVMAGSAIAILAKKLESKATNGSAHIDASMYEICVQQMTQSLRDVQSGKPAMRMGNDRDGVYYQAVLPCEGDDRWIAICTPSVEEYSILTTLSGGVDLAIWTATQEPHALCELLQNGGIQAGVVADIEDMMERDPQLKFRSSLVLLDHAVLAPFEHIRTPINFSVDKFSLTRSPSIGEHNDTVAEQVCGLSLEQISSLKSKGLFT